MTRLTVSEAAAELRSSERFVLDEIRRRNLRASKPGRTWLIERADLERYIDAAANVARVGRKRAS